MYCPKCGKENVEGAQLCSSCSWVLSSVFTTTPPNVKTSKAAIWALVLGILAPLTLLLTTLPAIICGIVALVKINKSRGQLKGNGLAIAGIAIPFAALPIVAMLLAILMPALGKVRNLSYRLMCGENVASIGKAMALYANDYNEQYPTPSKWCDLLVEKADVSPMKLKCKGANNDGRCNYAMNKNIEKLGIKAPPDIVVLFESGPGWNQCGGPELLSTENHCGECCVLFADSHVEFVSAKDIPNLKWTADAPSAGTSVTGNRIDTAKWSEGKAMMGTIATAIRAYAAEKGPNSAPPTTMAEIGLTYTTDLDGTYFTNQCYTYTVTSMNPLQFTITCTAANSTRAEKPTTPAVVTLNEQNIFYP